MSNPIYCTICSHELDSIVPSHANMRMIKYHYNFTHRYYVSYDNNNKIYSEKLNIFNTNFMNKYELTNIYIIHYNESNIKTQIVVYNNDEIFVSKRLNFYAIPITNSIDEIITECKKILLLI